jgi:putative addiction module component (TIGR02574 family)
MKLQAIEEQALHLPKKERAALIQKLLLSLDTPTQDELSEDWLAEAQVRAKQLDDGTVNAIPGNVVLRKARALIK